MNNKNPLCIKFLVISSILVLLSIFSFNYKIMGLGFLQYMIVIGWCFKETILKNNTTFRFIDDFILYNGRQSIKYYHEREYFKSSIYLITSPLVFFSILFVIFSIYCMIFKM